MKNIFSVKKFFLLDFQENIFFNRKYFIEVMEKYKISCYLLIISILVLNILIIKYFILNFFQSYPLELDLI